MSTAGDTTTQVIDLGPVQVAYTESGSGEPLILIHGGESDRNAFRVLFPHLGDGIRAIAYDQRDSGETVNPDEPYVVADMAQDLASFIAVLGLEKAHILGVSFGGAVAIHTALRHPERVASVTLVATLPRAAGAIDRASEVGELSPEKRRAAMFDLLFTPEGMRSNPDLAGFGTRALTERPRELMARRIAAVRDHDVIDQLPTVQVPALVIHGTDDPIAPFALAELTAERIPGAVLRPIPGGRHGIATEYAAEVAAHVRQFIGLGPA
ncbi:alpha/beta fold hydrolase [Desertimonas flava]|uniref:alpha/beta fold hydrolase n=1 Tax=Desertimonas flava TaxID=2064846 RepID=UPI000E355E09|nr:alpha/beta hydrolase [Desertimonas flava]